MATPSLARVHDGHKRNLSGDSAAHLKRVHTQLEFAEGLAQIRPELKEGIEAATALYRRGPSGEFEGWVAEIESGLAEAATVAKGYKIHVVGHGHIDMNWMWSWPETVSQTHDTFESVLNLMDRYPDLTFSQSQASVYALMERYHPETFERIKAQVKSGRWEVTAAHWVEGDKNLASGESLARHLMYTRRYFQDRFGLSPEDVPVDWEPDTFGHANTIPGILAQGAVKYYYSCRTGGGHHHERTGEERPPVFWWQGEDGARVLVNRETTWYNSYVNIGENFALPLVPFVQQTGLSQWLNVFGMGNHGGGPTVNEIEWIRLAATFPCYPTVAFSTSKAYFEAIEREIEGGVEVPTLAHELNFEFTGCYTSQSAIKRANRFGENYCTEAEGMIVAAELEGRESLLREAWVNVLFNQFHDILPGSGIAATREHALGLFQETGAITGAIKREAGKRLVADLDTASLLPDEPDAVQELADIDAGRANRIFEAGVGLGSMLSGISQASTGGRRFHPVVVYNPLPFARTEMLQVDLWDIDLEPGRLVARGEDGRQAPTMVSYRSPNPMAEWGHMKTTVWFPATDVPAFGYKTFLFCEGEPDSDFPTVALSDNEKFETPDLQFQLDRYKSGFREIARQGEDGFAFGYPIGSWWYQTEIPRGMTSWVLGGNGEEQALVGRSCDISGGNRNGGTDLPGGRSVAYLAHQHLRVPGTESSVDVRTLVHGLSPRLDMTAEIDWREIGTPERGIPGLYVEFQDNGEEPRFETPFGSIVRTASSGEVPTLRYAYLPDMNATVLQDSKYGHRIDQGALYMRMVRSSFDPDHAPEVGKQTVRYSMVFHDDEPSPAELARLGAAWNHPLLPLPAKMQRGSAPTRKSFAECLTPSVTVTSIKPGLDGGTLIRVNELAGEETVAQVRLSEGLLGQPTPVDLLERETEGEAWLEGDVLHVRVRPLSIASVLLKAR